jgi:hypothetical protein
VLERPTSWPDPLALIRHYLPLLPAATGHELSHWAIARALCSVAEDVVALAKPEHSGGLLPAATLAELAASTDELGRLLLYHLPFRSQAAHEAWPQVQAYLLQVLPDVERLLAAGSPFPTRP